MLYVHLYNKTSISKYNLHFVGIFIYKSLFF